MTKILNAKVDWMERYMNTPVLQVLVDKMYTNDEMVFTQKNTMYFGHKNGQASRYFYHTPSNGFGGRHFKLNMDDGTTKTLIGPWDGGILAFNVAGFPQCVDVHITDNKQSFERGYTFIAGTLFLHLAKQAAKIAGVYLHKMENGIGGGVEYVPSLNRKEIIKPFCNYNGNSKSFLSYDKKTAKWTEKNNV